jgi:MOSC domain-containing protein YiiM
MRVLEPGIVQAGAHWIVEERFDEEASIPRINHCMYLQFDPVYANRMLHMTGLGEWWQEQASAKLTARDEHWTSRLKEE